MAGQVKKPLESHFKEPFSPLANELTMQVETFGDLVVAPAVSSEQNDFRAHYDHV
jgi:hypothetical protein